MSKTLAARVKEAEIASNLVTADRASLDRHDWKASDEPRWCINGYVACRSGAHVHVSSNWMSSVFMYFKWRGREHFMRFDDLCESKESLRRAAVAFAERVVKEASKR